MSSTYPLRPIIHLAVDLGIDYVSGLTYFNADYAYKLPLDINEFSAALRILDLSTLWTVRDDRFYCLQIGTANPSLLPLDRQLLAKPHDEDWISSKQEANALSNPELRAQLVTWNTRYAIVTGLSIEACVAETVMHLLQMGIDCIVPTDLVAPYTGRAKYGSAEFREWNRTALLHIYEKARDTARPRGNLIFSTSQEILAMLRAREKPAADTPDLASLRQAS